MAEKTRKLSTTQIILIVGLAVLVLAVAAVGLVLYQAMNRPDAAPEGPSNAAVQFGDSGNGVVGDATDGLREQLQKQVDDSMFEVNMNSNWTFPDGASASTNAFVANSQNNTKPIYFEVFLSDSEEKVYTSPKLPVGSSVSAFKLDKPLEPGTYEADCTYHLLNDDDSVYSTTSIVVRLTISA